MTSLNPNAKPVDWQHDTFIERVAAAKSLLAIHGFLTDAESEKVHQRLLKWVGKDAANAAGEE